jgi:hypothetical protein
MVETVAPSLGAAPMKPKRANRCGQVAFSAIDSMG